MFLGDVISLQKHLGEGLNLMLMLNLMPYLFVVQSL